LEYLNVSNEISKAESILIIHQGALGDFILALPIFEAIRRINPEAKIYFMGYPRILELVENRFYANKILSIDQRGMATFFVQNGSLDLTLTQFFKGFEVLVIFGKDSNSAMIKNLRKICRGRVLHINSFPPWEKRIHLTDHLIEELSNYGLRPYTFYPRLYLNKEDREWAKSFLKTKGIYSEEKKELIIVHPGSGSRKKVWPIDRFLNISRFLEYSMKKKILIILGPAEGIDIQKAFENLGLQNLIIIKGLSLIQLASIIEGCKLFIGNDSGISHMASALGVPVIAIFGPTDPRVWSPRGEDVIVLNKEIPCSPCSEERFFKCRDSDCLKMIEEGDVLKALEKFEFELNYKNKKEEKYED